MSEVREDFWMVHHNPPVPDDRSFALHVGLGCCGPIFFIVLLLIALVAWLAVG